MTQGLITSAQNERLDGAGKITRCEKVKQTRIQRADNARTEKTASGPDAFDTRDSQSCSSVSTDCQTCRPTSSYDPQRRRCSRFYCHTHMHTHTHVHTHRRTAQPSRKNRLFS